MQRHVPLVRHKPMRRMSEERRELLAAAGITWPTTTLIVLPGTSARVSSDPTPAEVAACLARDGCACVRCLTELFGRRGFDWSIHHRVRRSQGGDNRLSNLVSLCGSGTTGCHGRVHAAPAAARAVGLLLRRGAAPAAARLLYAGAWSRLTDDGRVIEP